MGINIQFYRIPALGYFALGAMLALLLVTLFLYPQLLSEVSQNEQRYARALANTAANRATDATLNHDLVSLQLVLKDITTNNGVLLASIHDVENELLVQSGDGLSADHKIVTATAPVVLHDSIAGTVTILLRASSIHQSFLVFTLIAMGTALLIFLWACRDRTIIHRTKHCTDVKDSETAAEQLSEPMENTVEKHAEFRCFCHLYLHNLSVLKQQLNEKHLYEALNQLEQNIIDVMTLYGGQNFDRIDDHYILTFKSGDSIEDLAFFAICCAYLLRSTSSIVNDIPLDLGFLVSDVSGLPEKFSAPQIKTAAILIDESISSIEELHSRFTLMSLDENSEFSVLTDVKSPYLSLLENQRRQLNV